MKISVFSRHHVIFIQYERSFNMFSLKMNHTSLSRTETYGIDQSTILLILKWYMQLCMEMWEDCAK